MTDNMREQIKEVARFGTITSTYSPSGKVGKLATDLELSEKTLDALEALFTQELDRRVVEVLDDILLNGRGKTVVDTPEGWQNFVQKQVAYVEKVKKEYQR